MRPRDQAAAGRAGWPGGIRPYREVTVAAVLLGLVQGFLMTAAFVYVGLKLGFTLPGSTVAAIMGFLVLRGVMRRGTIVENNINQTVASGINIGSSGIIFTVPALLLLDVDFPVIPMTLAAVAGSFLGICIIIPLRRQMVDLDRLRFPSGTAVAAILKAPGAGMQKAAILGSGMAVAVVLTLLEKNHVISFVMPVGEWLNLPDYTQSAIELSLLNIGAGLLAGRAGLPFVLGGVLAYWIIGPVAVGAGWTEGVAGAALTDHVYLGMLRPLGIGTIIGGAVMGVFLSFASIRSAITSLIKARAAAVAAGRISDEMPARVIGLGLAGAVILLFTITYVLGIDIGIALAFVIAIVGTLWLSLAGIIVAECTGLTDISPLSGLALIGVTLMMAMTGNQVLASVAIGCATAIAASQTSDMMQDLKTGYLVGSRPVRQQAVQFAVAWIGPILGMAVMLMLWKAGPDGTPGFGPDSVACQQKTSDCLAAPQAGALAGMIEGIRGGDAPTDKYIAGGGLGILLGLLPIGGLGVLVGLAMYLPFSITLGYGVGILLNMLLVWWRGASFFEDKGVPLAAGFIVGQALTELCWSVAKVIGS